MWKNSLPTNAHLNTLSDTVLKKYTKQINHFYRILFRIFRGRQYYKHRHLYLDIILQEPLCDVKVSLERDPT